MTISELVGWHRKVTRRAARFLLLRWLVGGLLGLLFVIRLWNLLESWRGHPDTVGTRLFLLATASSLALISHSTLSTFKTAFSAPAVHRLSLPISPARLLRLALWEKAADLASIAPLLALAAVLSAIALGWQATVFWTAVLTGLPLWIWLGFMAGLLLVQSPWAPLSAMAGSLALWWLWSPAWSTADLPASSGDALAAAAVVGLASFLVAGPLAAWGGRRYQRALYSGQKQASRHSILGRLLVLAEPLRHWRSPTAALLRRGILQQVRSSFMWMRLVGAVAALYFLPRLVDLPARPWRPGFLVTSLVWLLFVVDGATSPIGSEGPRLQLYLASPLPIAALLRAKMSAYLMAIGFINLGLLLLLAWLTPPDTVAWPEALAILFLLTLGLTPIYVLGSCLDANPHQPLPSGLEGRLFEEAPITGIRLALVFVGAAYLSLCLLAFQRLGLETALALILVTDGGLFFALWRPACNRLKRY